jgi:thiol-disulfide isomerase/thioredoxin
MNYDIKIQNVMINYPADADSVLLKENFTGYKIIHEKKKSPNDNEIPPSLVGYQSKKLVYPSFNGSSVTLLPAKGKYMLLDFWETWCSYCFLAMPKVKELHEKYNGKGLEVVGVVLQNKLQVEKIIKAQAFPYPTVFGDDQIKNEYRLESRPRYILIDDSGKVLADSNGDLEPIEKIISERLK